MAIDAFGVGPRSAPLGRKFLGRIMGSFQIEGSILKAPISNVQNMLRVSKASFVPIFRATIRLVAKSWLGTFSGNVVLVRCTRMILAEQ